MDGENTVPDDFGDSPKATVIKEVPCANPEKKAFEVRGVQFTVDKKYRVLKAIGVGAYGVVVAAIDTNTGQRVALKKISSVFDDITDAKRILREIRLMKSLHHENILPLYDMESPDSLETFDEVYMASPLFDKDLNKVIESDVELSDEHFQYFVYQILCALKYLHSASVMHRDLKPANILLQESCDLTLCDFGLARYVEDSSEMQNGMTEYVVTRWYRAPELVLTHEYTNAVDLWAVGCIMGDLLGRKVMFPGKDFKHQVETICEVLGKPGTADYEHVTSGRARKFLQKLPETRGVDFRELFPGANPMALDLMSRLLQFNPSKRPSAAEALRHPYLKEFHDEAYEKTAEGAMGGFEIEPRAADGGDLTIEELKRQIAREIYSFRPGARLFQQHPELIARPASS